MNLTNHLTTVFNKNITLERHISREEHASDHSYRSKLSRLAKTTSDCVFYKLFDHPEGPISTYQNLTFTGDAYSTQDLFWGVIVENGATITLPVAVESFTIYPWTGYEWYGYYAPVFAAYDAEGNLLGQVVVSPEVGYGATPVYFEAPEGTMVKSIFLTGEFVYTTEYQPDYPFTYWYYLDVCYPSGCKAPTLTAEADITEIWPPNNKEIDVTFSGTHTNECEEGTYTLTDEYEEYTYTGILLQGNDSFTLPLKATCSGKDKDGRKYTLTVSTSNESGSVSECVEVIVPHDKK